MLIEIGVGIICLGVGLFAGKMFFSKNVKPEGEPNLLERWIQAKQEKKAKEKEFAARQEAMFEEARVEALKELKPSMVEHIKQQELDKLTGKAKTNKLQKFADAFSMKGTGLGSTDKINMMLGVGSSSQSNNTNNSFTNDNFMTHNSNKAQNLSQEDIDYYLYMQKEKERKKHKARMLHEKTKQEAKPSNKYGDEFMFDFEGKINHMLK